MDKSCGQYQKLPPGWNCKYDQSTGSCYYVNYLTRAIQLEDPRLHYKQLQNERSSTESIPMQPMHGSPYHVYPSNNLPAVRAFNTPASGTSNSSFQNVSSSPLISSRGQLEMSPIPFSKTAAVQIPCQPNMSRRSTIQETSFTNQLNQFDTDAAVTKIQNMFPTASENHIRLLLKKYYNREAVVISALQVEKHPVTMPGPYVTPPSQRHLFHSNSAFYMTPPSRRLDIGAIAKSGFGSLTSRTASPLPGGRSGSVISMHSGGGGGVVVGGGGGSHRGVDANFAYGCGHGLGYSAVPLHGSPRFGDHWRSSPKPHSSPKMKLRYMKNIFPKADEMLLLDILSASDNNVQEASEKLIAMGYQKRDVLANQLINKCGNEAKAAMEKKRDDEKIIPLRPKEYTPEERETMKIDLHEKYPQIAERIILMALESVNFAEDRAIQILQIVQEEDEARAQTINPTTLQCNLAHSDASKNDVAGKQIDTVDNIISVIVVETTINNITNKAGTTNAVKMYTVPSINLTTPTTSNAPICIENESQPELVCNNQDGMQQTTSVKSPVKDTEALNPNTTNLPPTSFPLSLSSSTSLKPPLPSVPPSPASEPAQITFQRITTRDILKRSNHSKIGNNSSLHGSNNLSNSAFIQDSFKLSRSRDKSDSLKNSQQDSNDEADQSQQREFESLLGRIKTMGHNTELANGPNENLLLADYVTWNGANPDITLGRNRLAVGPDEAKLKERTYTPLGRNPDLCKGAKIGLAKGSIYAKLSAANSGKSSNIKCK